MWLGTYERDYPRARVLDRAGCASSGVEVVEHHRPVWERQRHKAGAFLRPGPLARARPGATRGPGPAWRREVSRERPVDAVVAGYPAQPDAVPAWCVARARGVPLVVDMMISLADTLGGDRALRRPRRGGRAGRRRPASACGWPTWCWPTPAAGADWLAERFGVPRGAHRGGARWAPSPSRFPCLPEPAGPPHALFYGKLAPLHGVATVLEAARGPGVAAGAADRRRAARALARGRARARPPRGPHLGAVGPLRGAGREPWPGRDLPRGVRRRATRPRGWCRTRSGRRWPPGGRW